MEGNTPRPSISNIAKRRLSIFSNSHDDGYHSREQVQSVSSGLAQAFPLRQLEDPDGKINQNRLPAISQAEQDVVERKGRRLLLFTMEPILTGCIIFPILVLFWDCGWNLVVIMLNSLNGFPLTLYLDGSNDTDEYGNYSPQSMIIPYVIDEGLLLILYLGQDIFFKFLKRQHFIVEMILLKCHILILATSYIVQWEMIWTILDQYTLDDWASELLLSLASLFALIVITGNLSDLVCSPFLVCYDSIEYCVQFECPLVTLQMNRWKINLSNFILYELIIANITIIVWHGFYTILDQYLYPDDTAESVWICLIIGYLLFFPLMYFQNYLVNFNLKCQFWTFFLTNFPEFCRTMYDCLAFASCLFIWRGLWVLFSTYVVIFEMYYETYLLIFLLSFGFLALIQTASSTNGPLSNMEDKNRFFPAYPHCYVSIVVRKLSQLSYFQAEKKTKNAAILPFGD